MKNIVLLASLAASFAAAATAHATQLVTNGSFSSLSNGPGLLRSTAYTTGVTDATGWTNTGFDIVFSGAATTAQGSAIALWDAGNGGTNSWNGTAPGGANFVALDGDFYTGPIAQNITGLTAGKTYTLSFQYAFAQQKGYTGAVNQVIGTTFGGNTVFISPNYANPSEGFSGWSTATINVTANSASEVLSFLSYGSTAVPPFALLTQVSLTSAVPEPATWGMMIVGLAAMGAAARLRRRRKVPAIA